MDKHRALELVENAVTDNEYETIQAHIISKRDAPDQQGRGIDSKVWASLSAYESADGDVVVTDANSDNAWVWRD